MSKVGLRWPTPLAILVAVGIVIGAGYLIASIGGGASPTPETPPGAAGTAAPGPPLPAGGTPDPAGPTDTSELDRLIGEYERLTEAGTDATQFAFLGRLHLIRARLTGDVAGYARARDALERARELAPEYLDALSLLVWARVSLHDFAGATVLADQVLLADPERLDVLALSGDAALALGEVDEAARVFEDLDSATPNNPAVLVRLSQVAWTRGEVASAVDLAATATRTAVAIGLAAQDVAWYHSYEADLAFDQGQFEAAAERYEAALEADPEFAAARGGLARIRAAQGNRQEAIDLYLEATSGLQDPELLAALGDLYLLQGQPDLAAARYSQVEEIGLQTDVGNAYTRMLAEFYLDRDREAIEALRLTTEELQLRRDVHGWDAHAWALYRNGRFDEARAASDQALLLGTAEAEFWYHAGLISAALGETARARQELETALELNPEFDPIQSAEARRVLLEITGET